MSNLKSSLSTGPDGIPSIIVKNCPSLIRPITILANRSFSEGKFLDCAKLAIITPIHKTGSKAEVENYRPIAFMPVIPKLIEGLMSKHIIMHARPMIGHFQHGFVPRRSTTTNLASFCQHAVSAIENGSQLDVLYVDFSKAFDKVDHSLLLLKIRGLGFADSIIDWISSFIHSWSYRVRANEQLSHSFIPSSGVPQGTHLGPILFILFTIDLPSSLNFCNILSFADDTKIFARIASPADSLAFQRDIDAFMTWCSHNGMHINPDKTQIMSITRCSSPIYWPYKLGDQLARRTTTIKDLGVSYDCSLDFSLHIEGICARAFRLLGFIKRCKFLFNSYETILYLYVSLVRPLLEHASTIWSPYLSSQIGMIESIQRNITRYILNTNHTPEDSSYISYPNRCQILNIDPLFSRRIMADALFIRGLLIVSIDAPELNSAIIRRSPELPTRYQRPFFEELHRTRFAQNAPMPRCIHTLNLLFTNPVAPNLESCSRASFIQYCKEHLDVVGGPH